MSESPLEGSATVRSASVPSDILSALEHDLCGSRSPLTAAPRNPKAPGRVCDVAEVLDEHDMHMVPSKQVEVTVDPLLPKLQGRRSQRSIPSTVDASWEDPGPTVEFDLTQLDSSDDQCNVADACRRCHVWETEIIRPQSFGKEEFIPVSGGRRSCQKAVHSGSTSEHFNRYALLMDDGSQRGLRRLVLINGGGASMPDNTQDDWDSSEESVDEEATQRWKTGRPTWRKSSLIDQKRWLGKVTRQRGDARFVVGASTPNQSQGFASLDCVNLE